MFDNLWVEKYRPAVLDDICLPPHVLSKFNEYKIQGECPNLLFVGTAGIGKTSLAKITVNDILKCQYLYINASDENGIDTIRTKVTRFSQIKSVDGGIKVIILDEVDGLTIDAQRALRNTMEEYSKHVRFILTANYTHKVITPLHSRSQFYDVTPSKDQCYTRCEQILNNEKVSYSADDLLTYVNRYYPDLRKCINELQRGVNNGKLIQNTTTRSKTFVSNVLDLTLSGKVLKLRKHIIENEQVFNKDYCELMKQLFEAICDHNDISTNKKQQCLVVVAEHMYRSAHVVDQEINFFSCLLMLSQTN